MNADQPLNAAVQKYLMMNDNVKWQRVFNIVAVTHQYTAAMRDKTGYEIANGSTENFQPFLDSLTQLEKSLEQTWPSAAKFFDSCSPR